MDKFVIGFAYTRNNEHSTYDVLLMKKNSPEWQKDCLNGVGGKVEGIETLNDAMERKCFEETGLVLDWNYRGMMEGKRNDGKLFQCHIFYAYGNNVINFQQIEDEPLALYAPSELWQHKIIEDLKFLIPFGLSNDDRPFMRLEYK